MPITFAHPALILPLTRLRRESGWLGGLVAGSVTPDILQAVFGYNNRLPHTPLGLILLDVPLAVVLTWFAHLAITPRLRRMPGLETIRAATSFSWKWASVAAFTAAAIHLALDLFTHAESPLASNGILALRLSGPDWNPFAVSNLLWYVGSGAGTVTIAVWLAWRAWHVPGGWRRFLSWRWAILATMAGLPFLPILRVVRHMYTPDLLEFLPRLTYLANHIRISLLLSFFLALASLYAVTVGRRGASSSV